MKDKQEKIKWYQDVLEIEPSSRIFFPLARLLAEEGRLPEAIRALQEGLKQHPDFFEARLMLVDLVQREGDASRAASDIAALGENLCAYPGFWEAWAAQAEKETGDRSLVFALRFLAAHLKNRDLTLFDILEKGVREALEAEKASTPRAASVPVAAHAAPLDEAVTLEAIGRESLLEASALRAQADAPREMASAARADQEAAEADEKFSLRTRTMAALLAEQGDYEGALDIYHELLRAAADEGQREEIGMCIRNVQARMKNAASSEQPQTPRETRTAEADTPDNRDRIVKTLEMLARRLETRANA